MDPNSGRIYELRELDDKPGEEVDRAALLRRLETRTDRTQDEDAAVEHLRRDGKLVPVSGEVAQKVRLGERELERRRRRRRLRGIAGT